ncbi:MAG: hypothetical protein A2078_07130 [Nitrospirae bacterium GWC2_57_9]|nr:MAG: hypothetical protein A2078_07130 [Nitrospirae bacterium GWC2_57_9]
MVIKEKTHRLDRELYRGVVSVSFTLCIQDKKRLFIEPNSVQTFINILTELIQKTPSKVPVYCFMPDHLHLLIQGTSSESDVWKTVVSFKQKTGFWLASNKPEIKWQKDFYDHVVRNHEKFAVLVRYILDNPVRKGLARSWEDYPYKGAVGYELNDVLNGIL